MHIAPGEWGPRTLTNWQFARMLLEPKCDVGKLRRDYFARRYGPAARAMERLYDRLERATANIPPVRSWSSGALNRRLRELYRPDRTNRRGNEQLFLYDHLGLAPGDRPSLAIGVGLSDLESMVASLERIASDLHRWRAGRRTRSVATALREDAFLIGYTHDVLRLHLEMARFWHAGKYGSRQESERCRRAVRSWRDRLQAWRLKCPALDEWKNALHASGLEDAVDAMLLARIRGLAS